MAIALPKFLYLVKARAEKTALLASLSPLELEIFEALANGGMVFGSAKTGDNAIALSTTRSTKNSRRVDGGGRVVRDMVRSGWLRFAKMAADSGYFWLTDSAERLHGVNAK